MSNKTTQYNLCDFYLAKVCVAKGVLYSHDCHYSVEALVVHTIEFQARVKFDHLSKDFCERNSSITYY